MLARVQPLSAHQGILQVLWLNKQVLKDYLLVMHKYLISMLALLSTLAMLK
ncbi:hypothetical protein Q604_UNBc4C00126G0001, partial [human gut metagenome]